MIVRELYNEAVEFEQDSLLLLLDFLIFEKQALTMEDDTNSLDLYFKPNNKDRLNKLLADYNEVL